MSQWHRDNPELAGSSADPWMASPSYRAARDELIRSGHVHVEDHDRGEVCGDPFTATGCGCS